MLRAAFGVLSQLLGRSCRETDRDVAAFVFRCWHPAAHPSNISLTAPFFA
jgi:hypothetical protein